MTADLLDSHARDIADVRATRPADLEATVRVVLGNAETLAICLLGSPDPETMSPNIAAAFLREVKHRPGYDVAVDAAFTRICRAGALAAVREALGEYFARVKP